MIDNFSLLTYQMKSNCAHVLLHDPMPSSRLYSHARFPAPFILSCFSVLYLLCCIYDPLNPFSWDWSAPSPASALCVRLSTWWTLRIPKMASIARSWHDWKKQSGEWGLVLKDRRAWWRCHPLSTITSHEIPKIPVQPGRSSSSIFPYCYLLLVARIGGAPPPHTLRLHSQNEVVMWYWS